MNTNLGPFVRSLRKEKKLTLKELSDISNVSFAQIGKIERRETHPSRTTIIKIARAISYDQNKLLELAGYKPIKEKTFSDLIDPELRYQTIIKYDRTCQLCGAKAPTREIELTLINPKATENITPENLIVLCNHCNHARDKIIKERGIENDYLLKLYQLNLL
ncbi:MAG: helix-turn-helix domain-containing protein [Bacillota bacterium]